jgi:mono/diheme cytochrome c family protein
MRKRTWLLYNILVVLVLIVTACGGSTPVQPVAVETKPAAAGQAGVSYAKDIQPIFNDSCVGCHGKSGGLTLTDYNSLMAGGAKGPVIVANNPDASELYKRITGQSQPSMPRGGAPLSQDKIDLIAKWIKEGAANN